MDERIYLSPPHLTGEEYEFVRQALDSNWVAPVGPALTAFEGKICDITGASHCLAVNSGTSGIHLALIVLDVKPGDEVICPTFTFVGSCNPILYQGATPVFVDSEMETWNMDPSLLEAAITHRLEKGKKPKAIIVVDLFGMPAKMNEIKSVATRYGIPLVEDAAEAMGARYEGKSAGTFGDIGVFSFNGNKIVTTSGGGALVSKNNDWIEKARYYANQARAALPYYEHSELGYNYQLSNISASIGLAQLKALYTRVEQKRNIFLRYQGMLGNKKFSFQPEPKGAFSNRWLTTVLVNGAEGENERIRLTLEKNNIESRLVWKPMHLQPLFKEAPVYLSGVADRLFNNGLCLPSGTSLTEGMQDRIVTIVTRNSLDS